MTDADTREAVFARLREVPSTDDAAEAAVVPLPTVDYDARPGDEFPLRYPFTLDGLRVERAVLLPPASCDVEAVIAGRMDEREMHARMAGLPVAALDAMRWPDRERVTLMARYLAPEIGAR